MIARVPGFLRRANAALEAWCTGRNGYWRVPVLAWMVYIGVHHLIDNEYASLLFFLNAPIHEAGHFIMGVFGWMPLTVAAGTLFQLAAPIAGAFNFRRQNDWFAVSLCGVWLATNLYYVAWYMADSRSMEHEMFQPFGLEATIHDWNYMLGKVGLLNWDTTLARGVSAFACVVMWGSILAGAYMIWLMIRPKRV